MNGNHVEIEELIAAYAVHALDLDERAQVQTEILEHIAGCDPCRSLFRELNELSGELALATPPARVSQDLENRIMDAARGERPASTPRYPTRRWQGIAAGVAVAAVIALVVWNIQLGSSLRHERSNAREAILAMSLLNDPSAHRATLTGQEGSVLVALRPDGSAALAASGIPEVPDGRLYEVWFLTEGRPTRAAVFKPEGGTAIVTARVPGTFDAVGVTLERGPNGSSAPTGPLLYRGNLAG
jgi:anti-sigma-K factor RskA